MTFQIILLLVMVIGIVVGSYQLYQHGWVDGYWAGKNNEPYYKNPKKEKSRIKKDIIEGNRGLMRYAMIKDLQKRGMYGQKSNCCEKQIITCGIDDRAIECPLEICDEIMCSKCKHHCTTMKHLTKRK